MSLMNKDLITMTDHGFTLNFGKQKQQGGLNQGQGVQISVDRTGSDEKLALIRQGWWHETKFFGVEQTLLYGRHDD